MSTIRDLPLGLIFGNPDQPRKEFEPTRLAELAASIKANSLIQPIKVTPRDGGFMIVAGERRFRAHQLLGRETIRAIVEDSMTDLDVLVEAIVENGQRVDVHPLEEAVAYQAALDKGMTAEALATRLGLQQPWRVTERTILLTLRPEYQQLFRANQLGASQAQEMAQLSPHGQDRLFRLIKTGQCPTYNALRSAGLVIRDSEAQTSLLDESDAPSAHQRQLAKGLERRFAQVAAVLRASTVDNEIVAIKKIDPARADTLADLLAAMQGELRRIEAALRAASAPVLAFEQEKAA